jgi:hypothetical protein
MVHEPREALGVTAGREEQPTAIIIDGCTLKSTPERGRRSKQDGPKRRKGSTIHIAIDTLGH